MSLQQMTDVFELPLLRLSMLLRPSRCVEDARLLFLRLRRCRRMLLVMLPRVPTPPSSSELQGLSLLELLQLLLDESSSS